MKPDPADDPLLDDVLDEAAPPDFRTALLEATLHQARRRRRLRRVRRVAVPAALLAAVALLVWWNGHPPAAPITTSPEPPCRIVHTDILPPKAMVATQPFPSDRLIATESFAAIVHTTPGSGGFRFINDDELLALVGRPAALVRVGPHAQELIFVSPRSSRP